MRVLLINFLNSNLPFMCCIINAGVPFNEVRDTELLPNIYVCHLLTS